MALRKALRMTEAKFARAVGVSPRTVANWLSKPETVPLNNAQDMLDELLNDADASVVERFERFARLQALPGQDASRSAQQAEPTLLKELIRQRRYSYKAFRAEYEKAAAQVTVDGTAPSSARYYRWISGQLKGGLPYPDACRVLEAMFAPWPAASLFGPGQPALCAVPAQAVPRDQASPRVRRLPGGGGTDPERDEFLAWRAARRAR